MYCPKCGAQNPDDAARCVNCLEPMPNSHPGETASYTQPAYNQQPYVNPNAPPKPSTFLVGNIILTVLTGCTCIPLVTGIIGIVFSAMVSSKYNQGDYAGAKSASTVAKIMFFVTLGLGIALLIFSVIYAITVFEVMRSPLYQDFYQEFFNQQDFFNQSRGT